VYRADGDRVFGEDYDADNAAPMVAAASPAGRVLATADTTGALRLFAFPATVNNASIDCFLSFSF
jgi:hypothetical protein